MVGGARHADHGRAAEGDGKAGEEPARESLAQDERGEEGDHDRSHVDHHRGGARVDQALALIERHVVDTEPEHAAGDDGRELPPPRERQTLRRHHRGERDAAHDKTAERERRWSEMRAGRSDRHERRRPQECRHEDRQEDPGTLARACPAAHLATRRGGHRPGHEALPLVIGLAILRGGGAFPWLSSGVRP